MTDFYERVRMVRPLCTTKHSTEIQMRDALLFLAGFEVTEEFIRATQERYEANESFRHWSETIVAELKERVAKAGEGL